MASSSRPMKYRRIIEVEAFHVTHENTEAVARWCGGRYITEPAPEDGAAVIKKILVPYFNPAGNIDVATAKPGDYVIKTKDGTHDVWSAKAFAEQQLEPFYHRGAGIARGDTMQKD